MFACTSGLHERLHVRVPSQPKLYTGAFGFGAWRNWKVRLSSLFLSLSGSPHTSLAAQAVVQRLVVDCSEACQFTLCR